MNPGEIVEWIYVGGEHDGLVVFSGTYLFLTNAKVIPIDCLCLIIACNSSEFSFISKHGVFTVGHKCFSHSVFNNSHISIDVTRTRTLCP
jgi:hypothetical protein